MSDKLNGVFDNGFSGIIYEGKRKSTMPLYIERLAERTMGDSEVEAIEPIKLDFSKSTIGLTRASDLSNDECRTVESRKVKAEDMSKEIETEVQELLSVGQDPEAIEKALSRKFPTDQVKKYLESHSSDVLKKYGEAALKSLSKTSYKDCKELEDTLRSHIGRLKTESSMKVFKSFYDYARNLKKVQQKTDTENKVSFKRDIDKKEQKERLVENNVKRNAFLKQQQVLATIFQEFKSHILSGFSKDQANQKIAKKYSVQDLQKFHTNYVNRIDSTLRFASRQAFTTDFRKLQAQDSSRTVNDFESQLPNFQEKKMLAFSYQLLTEGKSLREVKRALKQKFEYKHVQTFLKANENKLQKHYGQIGYVFIDANAYTTCDEMKKAFSGLTHAGKQLVYAVKACSKCKGCVENKQGTCGKCSLMISKHPIVRSSRAARRVLARAVSFVPKTYIDQFASKITEEGNISLVSNFTLGIKQAIEDQKKNIGKKASLSPDTLKTQESFELVNESYNVDPFKKTVASRVIDSILNNE